MTTVRSGSAWGWAGAPVCSHTQHCGEGTLGSKQTMIKKEGEENVIIGKAIESTEMFYQVMVFGGGKKISWELRNPVTSRLPVV